VQFAVTFGYNFNRWKNYKKDFIKENIFNFLPKSTNKPLYSKMHFKNNNNNDNDNNKFKKNIYIYIIKPPK